MKTVGVSLVSNITYRSTVSRRKSKFHVTQEPTGLLPAMFNVKRVTHTSLEPITSLLTIPFWRRSFSGTNGIEEPGRRKVKSFALRVCLGISLLFNAWPAFGQGESAVPFLLITPSIDGNGMGGMGVSVGSDNATSSILNPGQLGLFSLHSSFNVSVYTPKTQWLPQFHLSDLQYEAWGINAALKVNDLADLPFRLGVGIGYSKVNIDLGTFVLTSSSGPGVLGRFTSYETSANLTIGLGFEYVIRAALGVTFKSVDSHLSPIGTELEAGTGSAKPHARDIGLMAVVPVPDVVEAVSGTTLELVPSLKPLFDIGFGFARCNTGDPVVYADVSQADPLPRKSAIGTYIELGLSTTVLSPAWKPLTFMIAHEAEDVLVTRRPDGTWEYQTGLGDISFVDNVLLGKSSPNVWLRRGWQLQVCEVLYLRGGSVEGPGLRYDTKGYTLCLGGVFKMIMALSPEMREAGWFRILADLLDFQYASADYSGPASTMNGTSFRGISLVLRTLPFAE